MDMEWAREEAKSIVKHGGLIAHHYRVHVDDWLGDGDVPEGIAIVVIKDNLFTVGCVSNKQIYTYTVQANLALFHYLSMVMVRLANEIDEKEAELAGNRSGI